MNPQTTAPATTLTQAPAPAANPTNAGITAASPQTATAVNLPATPQYDSGATLNAVRQFYQIPTAAANASAGVKAAAFNAQTAFENSQRNLELRIQRAQDSMDPSKYHAQYDPNGGPTKIFNSIGQEVDAGTFAKLTGEPPTTILKNSNNTQEKQFINDYNNFQTYMSAKINPDNKEAQAVVKSFEANNPGLANLTPDQARQIFMAQYGNYFGAGAGGQTTPGINNFQPIYNPQISQYLYERGLLSDPSNFLYQMGATPGRAASGNNYGVSPALLQGLYPSTTGQ